MVDQVVWVRVLNPTLEHRKIFKNAKNVCSENREKYYSRIQQSSPENNAKSKDEFDFRKHVNARSMSLPSG